MKIPGLFSLLAVLMISPVVAQERAREFAPGDSLQSWQDPRLPTVLSGCSNPADPFAIPGSGSGMAEPIAEQAPEISAVSTAIPGVIATGQRWETVWWWAGNNADGPIATEDGGVMFANNDASNVIRLNPDGSAEIVYTDTNTGGALSRSKNGDLFLLQRGLNPAVEQLEPQRRIVADSFQGDPLDCVGGIVNDLIADSRGGVYFTITLAGLYYADPAGEVSRYGEGVIATNGIMLSPDEDVLYVTNGPVVVAFDVEADGSLSNQRDFATLSTGGGDGMAVDREGRLYVSTGSSVDVFTDEGDFLGNIPGPDGLHGVAFSGENKQWLYAIVLNGGFTANARNRIIRIPMLVSGYAGRAK